MDDTVLLSAQEAAERLLTIKIAGILFFVLLLFAAIELFLMWKYSEDRRKTEADNAADRIMVTEKIGTAMTDVLKEDSGWKAQYYALKAKYDALETHANNMEWTLDSATGANGFRPQERKNAVQTKG